jgi:Rieske Fe-S protein
MNPSLPDSSGNGRRGFLSKTIAVCVGMASCAVPSLAGIVAYLNPWREKIQAGESIRVASLASLPVGGPPQRFPIIADRSDAWNRYPAEPVGAVFLRRIGEKEIEALQVICPHAGCFINFDPKTSTFFCPCHGATFSLEGIRKEEKSVSPRDLDSLDVEIRGNEVWVKFEKFQTGTPKKIVKT